MSAVKDLTKGSPMKLILGFMLPMLLGLLFQQFYNMVDTIVVGQFLGVNALAGVGSTGSVNFLVLGFCMGVCAGFAIPVAQKFGEKDFDGLRKFVGNTIWLGIGFAAVMTTATCLLCGNILHWMNTPDTVFKEAYDYIFVIFLGIPVTFLYNILSGFIRSLGDSKSPVVILIISSILNVGLDLLFILVFDMGVAGAGWATVLAQLISGIACLVYMIKRFDILHLSRKDLKPDAYSMSRLCAMGVPMGLQYSITAIGSILLQSAVNSPGETYMAAVIDGAQTEILDLAKQFLWLNVLFYIPLAFVNIIRFSIQGLGNSQLAVFAGVFEMIARGGVALGLVPAFGYVAVCLASPAAWVLANLFLFPAFFHSVKILKNRFPSSSATAEKNDTES